MDRNPNNSPVSDKYHPSCPGCRAEISRPIHTTTTTTSPVVASPSAHQKPTSNALGDDQGSGSPTADNSSPELQPSSSSSSRRGRRRGRDRRQEYRARDTPPMMLAFLARGAEEEAARRGSVAVPQQLPHRGRISSLEDVVSSTSVTPSNATRTDSPISTHDPTSITTTGHNPATPPTPTPSSQTGQRNFFSDPYRLNISDDQPSSSGTPSYFHVTVTYLATQGGLLGPQFRAQASWTDHIGFWSSLAAAQEAAERYSQFPKFRRCHKTVSMKLLADDAATGEVRGNGSFEGIPISEPVFGVEIEIVESPFRIPPSRD